MAVHATAQFRTWWAEPLRPYTEGHAYRTITVLEPFVIWVIDSAVAAAILGLLGIAGGHVFLRNSLWALATGVIGIVLIPYFLFLLVWGRCGDWTFHDQVHGKDGRTYVFMDSSCLQGQTIVLARPLDQTFPTRTNEALGNTNGDSPRSFVPVVRPAGAQDRYGQLYVTENGLIVGVRSRNQAYLAYDPASATFWGHGPIEMLSPFVLLDAHTAFEDADVARLEETVRTYGFERRSGLPREAAVRAGLDHPNQSVRVLAQRLLELGNAESTRLAT